MAGFLRSIGIKLKSYGLFVYTRNMVATHVKPVNEIARGATSNKDTEMNQ